MMVATGSQHNPVTDNGMMMICWKNVDACERLKNGPANVLQFPIHHS